MRVYLKNLMKGWKGGVITPFIISLFTFMIGAIWPSFQEQSAAFAEILQQEDEARRTRMMGYVVASGHAYSCFWRDI